MNLQKRNRNRNLKKGDTNNDGVLSYREMQAECKKRGLPANGTKADLQARLAA